MKKTCILKGCVSLDIVYMWLELLKLEGLGFFQVEVVKDLSQKARVLSVLFLHGFWGSSNLAIYSSSGIESDSARYVVC